MYEFFWRDYRLLSTINMLCHVEVMFIQLLNLLKKKGTMCIYIMCLLSLSGHKIV